jgi:hypothetical protein
VPFRILLLLLAALATSADVRTCECDFARPETARTPACSLCAVTEKQPPGNGVYLLKDIDPRKPNRWLVLPRRHYDGPYPLVRMTRAERTELWTAAIGKGKEMWGDQWAVAVNSDFRRMQCHLHAHVDHLRPGFDKSDGIFEKTGAIFVDRPDDIAVHADGMGLWFHPVGNRLHVHYRAEAPELEIFVTSTPAATR